MSEQRFGDIIRAGWRIVAVSVVVSVSVAFGITLLVTPVYESRAQMFVSTPNQTFRQDEYRTDLFSQQRIAAYAELVKGNLLASTVVDELALDLSPAELAQKVSMSYSADSAVFDVVATDNSPELARDIANTMAIELSAVVAELEAPEDGEIPSAAVGIRHQPETASAPIRPNTAHYLVIGAAVGLLLGVALVLIRRRSNRPAQ
ncbi:Wzz/FepE/Etk N-terminal domain-containing protein [Rhodococcus ruber]|uniref:Wzz/FepE/Etk N-terminal domain-containing protein n=1 Tax=Rhodococcus ruber TaxID=1830 RepID=A0ABT4MAN9_9NOCA|nr:Wzz/FepE/Etk N-terminal domain-containing protein [Rhodococcus ruber]MCZ4518038.1 Wzz/FepE/Etk N-terminal domain-containing protein [Rhodococcus ruber]